MRATCFAPLVLLIAACGKDGPPVPAGLDLAHLEFVTGTSDLGGLLDDVASAKANATERHARDTRNPTVALDAPPAIDLGSRAGWESAGIDVDRGLSVFVDDRVRADDRPVPILVLGVRDPDALHAALDRLGLPVKLEGSPTDGARILVDGTLRALALPLGDRWLIAPVRAENAERVRAGLERIRSEGAGDKSNRWRDALKAGSGPTLTAWASFAGLTGALRSFFGDDDDAFGMGAALFDSVGVALDRDGLVVRTVPSARGKDLMATLYGGTASPPNFARLVPGRGWAAARWSLDLDEGLRQAAMFPGGALIESLVDIPGVRLDDVRAALSGDVAAAVDLELLFLRHPGRAPEVATFDGWLAMVGVRDGDAADRLLDVLGERAIQAGDAVRGREPVSVDGQAGARYDVDGTPLVVVRRDDMIVFGPSTEALERAFARSDSMADGDGGDVLARRGSLAVAIELSPFVALLEREGRVADDRLAWLERVHGELALLPTWDRFREHPLITFHLGWDGDAAVHRLRDGGLLYGYAAVAMGMAATNVNAWLLALRLP